MRNHENFHFNDNPFAEDEVRGPRRRRRGPGGHGHGGPGRRPGRPGPADRGPEEPRGRRRGGRGHGRRGEVRTAILALLAEGPQHGYGLITAISERTQGVWTPSAGAVYPALGLLTDEGLISPTEVEGKRVFELTEAGRAHVTEKADELAGCWARVTEPNRDLIDLRHDLARLGMAVEQVLVAGEAAQLQRTRQVLETARRDVYRLLADDLDN